MWWEKKSQSIAPADSHRTLAPDENQEPEKPMTETIPRAASPAPPAHAETLLGRSMVLHGDLSGKEDLLIEGEFEGTISLHEHCLTVGPHGQVKAEIHARQVVIQGTVNGNVTARERIEIRKSGNVVGDLVAAAIAIEDGAYFKGSIDILREPVQEVASAVSAPNAVGSSA
jgi:cytoskeletal protein CcmA (bactofilin family)